MPVRNMRGRHRRKGHLPNYVYRLRAHEAKKKWELEGVVTLKMLKDVQKWVAKKTRKGQRNNIDWDGVEAEMTTDYKANKADKRVVKWVGEVSREDKAAIIDVLNAIEAAPIEGYTMLPEAKALTNSTVVPLAFLRNGKCLCAYKA